MATPLEELNSMLESINATERQRCFLRNFVQQEGITGIRYLGPRAPEQALEFSTDGITMPGHIIQGTIDGRNVLIFVGSSPDSTGATDYMNIHTIQPNGRIEEYISLYTRAGHHSTWLHQDIEPASTLDRLSASRWSGTLNGATVISNGEASLAPGGDIRPPDARHRRLNGYHGCQDLISRNDRFLRLKPFT